MTQVLIIEDDSDLAYGLRMTLSGVGFAVETASTVAEGAAAIRTNRPDLAIVDLQLPDGDGTQLLGDLMRGQTATICLTARADATSAVRALQGGARDYLLKPVTRAALLDAVAHVVMKSGLERRASELHRATLEAGSVIGMSPAWRRTLDLVAAVAKTPRTTVLVTGEPGVGKEVVASLVHRLGDRARGPFIAVNAATLTGSLVESELFGHEAGAFTGATRQRRGVFELAAGGTLFLDEIGELPNELQSKLLRVLEARSFRRVGGERDLATDARLIVATNRDLHAEVALGRFRADLYDRLRVFDVHVPPLRERREDIPALAVSFAQTLAPQMNRGPGTISAAALAALERYAFPGNVRELRNVVERALVLCGDGAIELAHLPDAIRAAVARRPQMSAGDEGKASPLDLDNLSLDWAVRLHVLSVYEISGENLTRAARTLGISRVALRKKLKAYGAKPVANEP